MLKIITENYMLSVRAFFYALLKWPVRLLVSSKIVPDHVVESLSIDTNRPLFYVLKHQSASDILALQTACKKLNLPDPLSSTKLNGESICRTICLDKPISILPWRKGKKTNAVKQGLAILEQHQLNASIDAQLIPVNLIWGRAPAKERNNANAGTLLADQESPTVLRKFFIVLFLGRHNLVRFSEPVSFRYMVDHHGSDEKAAKKVLRIARFHFFRQTIAATGPRLMHRQQMFTALLANPSIKRLISDEAKSKGVSEEKIKKQALEIMDEIAGDYRDATIRVGARILSWLFNRLYKKIVVNNADVLRKTAQNGEEIIYVPCHRSHMDYLLLTYVIYQQGLVTPRIAAGINLNFWPAGPIFRKAGAFFIRRSFGGNRLYSTIFREYLGLLFERGYSVKYYSEGGRSRTGKLLPPKTGMFAMTIQSLLRGIDRPLTLIPVYLGYEHVMEVATYHKELSGSKKQKESIFGVIKAIRNLRNYGMGYVNFGEPVNLNRFLNENVPNWKAAIDPIDPQKPSWLTPTVNELANQMMTCINKSTALNGVALISLILLASDHKALTKTELAAQVDFFLLLQKYSPYSESLTLPELSGEELVDHVISLNKVTVKSDDFDQIISLSAQQQLELSYYRNNILHTYVLPSLVCRILDSHCRIAKQDLIDQVIMMINLLRSDMFLWQNDEEITAQTEQLLAALMAAEKINISADDICTLDEHIEKRMRIRAIASCIDQSIQRFAILISALKQSAEVSKSNLETNAITIAKRLSIINDSDAPEFFDKRAQAVLITAMTEQQYIIKDSAGHLSASDKMPMLDRVITALIDADLLQSLKL
jgi:glycerol-3-phosphate O-acyltransferase